MMELKGDMCCIALKHYRSILFTIILATKEKNEIVGNKWSFS